MPSTQGWEGWRQLRPDRALPKYRVLLVLTQETTDFQSQQSHGVGSRKILRMGHGVKVEGNDTKTGEILSTFDIHSALFRFKVTLLVWESDSIQRLYRRLCQRDLDQDFSPSTLVIRWIRQFFAGGGCAAILSIVGRLTAFLVTTHQISGTSTASAVRIKMFPDTNIP